VPEVPHHRALITMLTGRTSRVAASGSSSSRHRTVGSLRASHFCQSLIPSRVAHLERSTRRTSPYFFGRPFVEPQGAGSDPAGRRTKGRRSSRRWARPAAGARTCVAAEPKVGAVKQRSQRRARRADAASQS
jgi:hypothetical protein